ncbi:MAG: hypothetical protein AAGE43_19220 [Pseudomonadota bacterium]
MNEAAAEAMATEPGFLAHWAEATAGIGEDPLALARAGGRAADRLAWVFASGYQAAVRHCFPEFAPPPGAWTCFAAAEPRDMPGCVLKQTADGTLLEGNKSWVAGAGVIERLVVAVGDGESRVFLHVPRNSEGVDILFPREPGFLAELSQGAASFKAVSVPADAILSDLNRAQWFRGAEPLFVLSALVACLTEHARRIDPQHPCVEAAEVLEKDAAQLVGVLGDKDQIVPGLRAFRAGVGAFLQTAEPVLETAPMLADSWGRDSRLLHMFGVSGDVR